MTLRVEPWESRSSQAVHLAWRSFGWIATLGIGIGENASVAQPSGNFRHC